MVLAKTPGARRPAFCKLECPVIGWYRLRLGPAFFGRLNQVRGKGRSFISALCRSHWINDGRLGSTKLDERSGPPATTSGLTVLVGSARLFIGPGYVVR